MSISITNSTSMAEANLLTGAPQGDNTQPGHTENNTSKAFQEGTTSTPVGTPFRLPTMWTGVVQHVGEEEGVSGTTGLTLSAEWKTKLEWDALVGGIHRLAEEYPNHFDNSNAEPFIKKLEASVTTLVTKQGRPIPHQKLALILKTYWPLFIRMESKDLPLALKRAVEKINPYSPLYSETYRTAYINGTFTEGALNVDTAIINAVGGTLDSTTQQRYTLTTAQKKLRATIRDEIKRTTTPILWAAHIPLTNAQTAALKQMMDNGQIRFVLVANTSTYNMRRPTAQLTFNIFFDTQQVGILRYNNNNNNRLDFESIYTSDGQTHLSKYGLAPTAFSIINNDRFNPKLRIKIGPDDFLDIPIFEDTKIAPRNTTDKHADSVTPAPTDPATDSDTPTIAWDRITAITTGDSVTVAQDKNLVAVSLPTTDGRTVRVAFDIGHDDSETPPTTEENQTSIHTRVAVGTGDYYITIYVEENGAWVQKRLKAIRLMESSVAQLVRTPGYNIRAFEGGFVLVFSQDAEGYIVLQNPTSTDLTRVNLDSLFNNTLTTPRTDTDEPGRPASTDTSDKPKPDTDDTEPAAKPEKITTAPRPAREKPALVIADVDWGDSVGVLKPTAVSIEGENYYSFPVKLNDGTEVLVAVTGEIKKSFDKDGAVKNIYYSLNEPRADSKRFLEIRIQQADQSWSNQQLVELRNLPQGAVQSNGFSARAFNNCDVALVTHYENGELRLALVGRAQTTLESVRTIFSSELTPTYVPRPVEPALTKARENIEAAIALAEENGKFKNSNGTDLLATIKRIALGTDSPGLVNTLADQIFAFFADDRGFTDLTWFVNVADALPEVVSYLIEQMEAGKKTAQQIATDIYSKFGGQIVSEYFSNPALQEKLAPYIPADLSEKLKSGVQFSLETAKSLAQGFCYGLVSEAAINLVELGLGGEFGESFHELADMAFVNLAFAAQEIGKAEAATRATLAGVNQYSARTTASVAGEAAGINSLMSGFICAGPSIMGVEAGGALVDGWIDPTEHPYLHSALDFTGRMGGGLAGGLSCGSAVMAGDAIATGGALVTSAAGIGIMNVEYDLSRKERMLYSSFDTFTDMINTNLLAIRDIQIDNNLSATRFMSMDDLISYTKNALPDVAPKNWALVPDWFENMIRVNDPTSKRSYQFLKDIYFKISGYSKDMAESKRRMYYYDMDGLIRKYGHTTEERAKLAAIGCLLLGELYVPALVNYDKNFKSLLNAELDILTNNFSLFFMISEEVNVLASN